MSKRILSALLTVLFLITGLPGTAWAVGEGNMEAGGGQTETVTGDSFWNGDWGIRFCVVDVASQTVVSAMQSTLTAFSTGASAPHTAAG